MTNEQLQAAANLIDAIREGSVPTAQDIADALELLSLAVDDIQKSRQEVKPG